MTVRVRTNMSTKFAISFSNRVVRFTVGIGTRLSQENYLIEVWLIIKDLIYKWQIKELVYKWQRLLRRASKRQESIGGRSDSAVNLLLCICCFS